MFRRRFKSILANTLFIIEHLTKIIKNRYLDGRPGLQLRGREGETGRCYGPVHIRHCYKGLPRLEIQVSRSLSGETRIDLKSLREGIFMNLSLEIL